MSKMQKDSYKIKESNIESIDEYGELIRIDLVLEENSNPIILAGKITGKVTDDIGVPLVASKVTLKYLSNQTIFKEVQTDANANYTIYNVPPNIEFKISASHVGYIPKALSNSIILNTLETFSQDIKLTSVLGIIFGILLDIYRRPVIGVLLLYLYPPLIPGAPPVFIGTTNTDKDGKFSFPDAPVGKYQLVAQTDIYKDVSTTFDYLDPDNATEMELEFEEEKLSAIAGKITDTKNTALSGAIVTLKTFPEYLVVTKVFTNLFGNYSIDNVVPHKSFVVSAIAMQYTESTSGAILTLPGFTNNQNLTLNDLLGSIVGKLLDDTSTPISGTLYLYVSSSLIPFKTTTATSIGDFSFTGIPRGSYKIIASNIKYKDVSTSFSYDDANFPLSVTLKFIEKNTAQIIGKITDTKNTSISGAIVTLKTSPDLLVITKVFSDSSGNYSITNIVTDKSYIVTAIANQYVESSSNVLTLAPASTVTQNLSLNDLLGSILGTLSDSSSNSVSGSLFLYDSTGTTLIKSTTSDSNGFFVFNNIPRGNYVILAKSPKYLDISTNISYPDANFSISVTLKFTTKVNATITGKITDSKNTPISSATVTLKNSSDLSVVTTVSSDASGNYSITNVITEKSYIVSAIANQYTESKSAVLTPTAGTTITQNLSLSDLLGSINGTLSDYTLTNVSGLLFLYDSLGTTLLASTSSDLNGVFSFAGISRGNYIILAQSPKHKDISNSVSYTNANSPLNTQITFTEKKTAQVKGKVLDNNNVAISSANVYLNNQFLSSTYATTTTDSTGSYLFNNVAIDTVYVLSVSSKQYISENSSPLNVNFPNAYDINFNLDDLLGSITGTLLNMSSNPISANLSLYTNPSSLSTISSFASTPIQTVTSGSDGKFTFSNIMRGSYTIIAQSPLFKDLSTSFSYSDATIPLNLSIKFTQSNFVNITGTVVNTKNQGIQNVTVTVKSSPNLTELAKTSTDSSGNYSINNISLNNIFAIYVSKDLYVSKNSNVFSSITVTTITQNFTLSTPSGTISGKVLDATNSNPVANALVRLSSINTNTNFATVSQDTYTDSSGVYTFLNVSVNQPGSETYRLKSVALGYINTESPIFTYTDATIPYIAGDIRTPVQLSSIRAVIKDASNNIIKNATATLKYYPSMNFIATTTYDPLVDYAFGNIYPGDYIITVTASGYTDGVSSVINVKFGDGPIGLYIILTVLGSIGGKILNSAGFGLANATVSLYYNSNSNKITSLTTDYYANYYFGSLNPNDYFVQAVLPGYTTKSTGKLTVVNGAPTINYNITLLGSGSIDGKVWDTSGYGITNVTVSLYYSSNSNLVKTTTTDGSAYYNFGSLEPNDYFVKASLSGYNDNYSGKITINGSNTTYNMTLIKSEYAPTFGTLAVSTPLTYVPLTYSATWGELYNSAVLSYNNTFVDYIGGFLGGHFYIYITAPFDCRYEINVKYLAGDRDRKLKIKVVEGGDGMYNYTEGVVSKTNSWETYDSRTGFIGALVLTKGVNKLVFYNDTGSYAPALSDLYFSYSQHVKIASVPNGSLFNGANNQWVEYWGNNVRFTVGIGGPSGGYVLMDYNFDIGGRYDLYFYYLSAGGDKPLSVTLNGNTNNYWFPATPGSWLTDARFYGLSFYPVQGVNTFKFFVNSSASAPALSYAEVHFVPCLRFVKSYQFTLTGSAYLQNDLVVGISSASGTMSANVTVDAPGYYDLTFKYIDPNPGRKMRIKINGVPTGQTYDLPPTADWNTVKLFTVKLYLDKWTNNILIYL